MKATGVVRKIDHLGRIVIPKEIRKNLKIRDGENLEIFVEEDTILLKKSSSFGNLERFAQTLVEILSSLLGKNIFITDMHEILACNSRISGSYLKKELLPSYISLLEKRETFITSTPSTVSVISKEDSAPYYYMFAPIVVQGDLIGSIFLFSEDASIQEKDKMMFQFALKFLEKNLEE